MGTLMLRGDADTPGDVFGANTSTAFQLAIWGVEFGGTLLDNANGPLATLVEQLIINASLCGVWYNPNSAVDLLDAPNGNQVLAFGVETPLPATLLLFAGGLGLLGFVGSRKRASRFAVA
jgi:PEP-CTERM motif